MSMKNYFCNLLMLIFMLSLVIEKQSMFKFVEGGKFCWKASRLYRGFCLRDANCETLCIQEGYSTGACKGFLNRKCMCGRDCASGEVPPPGEDIPPPGEEVPPPGGDFPPSKATSKFSSKPLY
ncbi:hypothetical protein M9H77_14905 [Catharanthus roseus]|uniref:Uncharacterized protein n=1 Tax=Catharanthus roseus TaxID=4058 RepID=A0ACC0BPG3_CATRO|nr:hypothetical protein M9H77_14905 [Catharanthus roseus]